MGNRHDNRSDDGPLYLKKRKVPKWVPKKKAHLDEFMLRLNAREKELERLYGTSSKTINKKES